MFLKKFKISDKAFFGVAWRTVVWHSVQPVQISGLLHLHFRKRTSEFHSFLGEMQRVAFSPVAIVGVCVWPVSVYVCVCPNVCVCVCVCMPLLWTSGKLIDINLSFSHQIVGHKKLFNEVFGDVVADDLDLVFESQWFESRPFRYIKSCYRESGDK